MTDDQIITVVQAHKEGKKIQVLAVHSDLGWQDCDNPSWDFRTTNYRVAPEPPKPREWWICEDGENRYHCTKYEPVTWIQQEINWIHVREVIE